MSFEVMVYTIAWLVFSCSKLDYDELFDRMKSSIFLLAFPNLMTLCRVFK